MEEKAAQADTHLSSAAAFVEGGIQEACDDACSICLEEFCDSDPSTVTECKHEFHLQCILEWCQRSSQCPMCWQPISLKDPTSQELLEAVEQERSSRSNRPRNTTIFHHPMLGDFELQHLPVDVSDAELEERILQHLAAAAAMGRSHLGRRDGHRSRSRGHGRPQYMVFSTQQNAPPVTSDGQAGGTSEPIPVITAANPSVPLTAVGEESTLPSPSIISNQILQASTTSSEANASLANRGSPSQSTPVNQDRAGPSDFQTLSETLKSRFNAVSMKYKESITKSTRGWRERLFSRNTSVADIGSEVRKEVNAGIASVSRMMEHLDTKENSRDASASHSQNEHSVTTPNNQNDTVGNTESIPAERTVPASSAAASSSS